MIDGVVINNLIRHVDERGFFQEIMRTNNPNFNEGFGQLSSSFVHQGVIKGWHGHKTQSQWTLILGGTAKVALHDYRKESKTYGVTQEFLAGDNHLPFIYKFPPGVLHGYKCINGPLMVLYITSGIYDLDDEVRIAHDDIGIGYNWLKKPKIT